MVEFLPIVCETLSLILSPIWPLSSAGCGSKINKSGEWGEFSVITILPGQATVSYLEPKYSIASALLALLLKPCILLFCGRVMTTKTDLFLKANLQPKRTGKHTSMWKHVWECLLYHYPLSKKKKLDTPKCPPADELVKVKADVGEEWNMIQLSKGCRVLKPNLGERGQSEVAVVCTITSARCSELQTTAKAGKWGCRRLRGMILMGMKMLLEAVKMFWIRSWWSLEFSSASTLKNSELCISSGFILWFVNFYHSVNNF